MTSNVVLLPCPFCGSSELSIFNDGVWCEGCSAHHDIEESDGGLPTAIAAWNTRACVEANTEALRAEVERLSGVCNELGNNRQTWADACERAEARAERLAEALRNLLDVGDKFTGDKDEDAATWCDVTDAARAALHPTAAQEDAS